MKLLLDERKKIIYIGEVIERTIVGTVPAWQIGNNFAIDDSYSVLEVASVPIEVIPYKYYCFGGTFVANPNYDTTKPTEVTFEQIKNQLNEIETVLNFLLMK
jgi:hypothetical protein